MAEMNLSTKMDISARHRYRSSFVSRLALLMVVVSAIHAGCVPSVRYTHDQDSVGRRVHKQRGDRGPQPSHPHPVPKTSPRRVPHGQLETVANSYLGTPYKYGGMSRSGTDCSGFVTMVFREVYNMTNLPRSSADMGKVGTPVALSAARPGDLVFFKNKSGRIYHVGIYMGEKRFIHASSKRGVVYNSLSEKHYAERFAFVRRVI